ncbi:unnamed protein product [Choristocarpus tenellus]
MAVTVPWSTLRPNPRDIREQAASSEEFASRDDGGSKNKKDVVWDASDFGRRMAFGSICGGITGITFGAMDGHRAIRDDGQNKFPTTALRTKEFTRLTALSGTIFTGFFCTYQSAKYAASLARKEDDFFNVVIASAFSIAPMLPFPTIRARFPYAVLLIAMDTLNSHVL